MEWRKLTLVIVRMAVRSWTTCHHRSNSICQFAGPKLFWAAWTMCPRSIPPHWTGNHCSHGTYGHRVPPARSCTAPIDAYVAFADSSKGLWSAIVSVSAAALHFSLFKLRVSTLSLSSHQNSKVTVTGKQTHQLGITEKFCNSKGKLSKCVV